MKTVTLFATLALSAVAALADEPVYDPTNVKLMDTTVALKRVSRTNAHFGTLTATQLPVWSYSITSPRDNNTYVGTIVGGNPFNRGARPVTVPTILIPVRFDFNNTARHFDPTSADTGCIGAGNTAMSLTQASPLFNVVPNYTMNGVNLGNVTYPDAFQRAQFWSLVSAFQGGYHLNLPVTVGPKLTITITTATVGTTFSGIGTCSTNPVTSDNPPRLGVIDINAVDAALNNFITAQGYTANQFPLFVIYGVVMSDGPPAGNLSNCCILGYHNGSGVTLAPGQTYGISQYARPGVFTGDSDIATMSHEIMEWVNDPSINNLVPAWGGLGQVPGCQDNLETGDPMSGTLDPVVNLNGKNWRAQEQAFFSWFLGGPSLAAGGKYSTNGTFTGFAKACPPGGTN